MAEEDKEAENFYLEIRTLKEEIVGPVLESIRLF
jgi:hypothetical protein